MAGNVSQAEAESKVSRCEAQLNYTFQNKSLCLESLQMSSKMVCQDGSFRPVRKNDKLTFLGIYALKTQLANRWFTAKRTKGEYVQAEQAVLANHYLANIGFSKGLQECVIVDGGTKVSEKMMAATLGAIFGAIYHDGGATAVTALVAALGIDHEFLQAKELDTLV